MVLDLLVFLAFAGIVWAVASEGAWGSALTLIDVVLAALIATNFWQPIAGFLSGSAPEWRFWWHFLVLILLFIVSLASIRAMTGALSPRLLRFPILVEQPGRWLFAVCTAWIFIGFFYMSLHTAPLEREFLGSRPERKAFMGTGPDRHWLGFMQYTSRKVFDRGGTSHVFDPQGIFLPSYASRRKAYENPESIQSRITTDAIPQNLP